MTTGSDLDKAAELAALALKMLNDENPKVQRFRDDKVMTAAIVGMIETISSHNPMIMFCMEDLATAIYAGMALTVARQEGEVDA